MLEGSADLGEAFNHAFLCCIPKSADGITSNGLPVHTAGGTRPISIVDASNRIIAAILSTAQERCVGSRISDLQNGFVHGRNMMNNLIDIDEAAQKVSINSTRGAILLFDFKAAFPSMDHQFIWDVLDEAGLPLECINAIRILYVRNNHYLRLGGTLFEGPVVHSGVRQGCPLSGLLFAICADVLLIRLRNTLHGEDEVTRAFADDTAVVIADYAKSIGTISIVFSQYAAISGLELNIKKTMFIPLWPVSSIRGLRNLVRELCPAWGGINIDVKGKYLGFVIGPGQGSKSWVAPMTKYNRRVAALENSHCGLF
jgi:hypothetical protein